MGSIFMVQAVKEDCFALEEWTDRCVTSQKNEDLISNIVHVLYTVLITSLLVQEESDVINIVIVSKYLLFMYFQYMYRASFIILYYDQQMHN
jgi:hypothetical protein